MFIAPMQTLTAILLAVFASIATAELTGTRYATKITTINGAINADHSPAIYVHAGDVLTLSADGESVTDRTFMGDTAAQIVWSADDSPSDRCDLQLGLACPSISNFVNIASGVRFSVPDFKGAKTLTLSASSHNSATVDKNGHATIDTLVLVNADVPPDVPMAVHTAKVTITSVNGLYDANHAFEVAIHPGDVINLSADSLDAENNFAPSGAYVEDFIWSADDATEKGFDSCDAAAPGDCLLTSNFQLNDYGVSFYAPYNMGSSIRIRVKSHFADSSDVMVLKNIDFVEGLQAPSPTVVTTAAEYPYPAYDSTRALAGLGRWVWINGVRYFAPYTYTINLAEPWQPYRNGYWVWDNVYGWTWLSYDPWGWATDHYGVWRHHSVYGWIWLPFEDRHYEAHGVTWLKSGDYIGWYPYDNLYTKAYRHGYQQGFDDGYSNGADFGRHVGDANYTYHAGFTIVHHNDVTNLNITKVNINRGFVLDQTAIAVVRDALTTGHFGRDLGGSRAASRREIENGVSRRAPVVLTELVKGRGGALIRSPHPVYSVPSESLAAAHVVSAGGGHGHSLRPLPLGTVVHVDSRSRTAVSLVAPTFNGRGVVAPVRVVDERGNTQSIVATRAKLTAAVNEKNPVVGAPPLPAAARLPHPAPTPISQLPTYDPKRPVPPETVPVATPPPR